MVSPANNGKTTLLDKLRRDHRPFVNMELEYRITPTVFVSKLILMLVRRPSTKRS